MPRTHPPYPPAFRAEAVRLVQNSGKSIPVIASDLGVSDQALRGWVWQAEIDGGQRDGLTSSEREELRPLRRENRIRKEERDILKKRDDPGGTTTTMKMAGAILSARSCLRS